MAVSIALEIASISLPSSTVKVLKPKACIRCSTFSVKAMSVLPSMEILLESYKMVNLSSFKVPARERASEEIPSIRQPSPQRA